MSGNPRELVADFYEQFGAGDMAAATSAFSEDVEIADPGIGTVHGAESFREYLETFKRAIPDGLVVVEHLYEADDSVIVEGRSSGPTPAR